MSARRVNSAVDYAKNTGLNRYLVAGGSAFATEYGMFLVLYQLLGVQVYVANSVSFCCGLAVSFSLNRLWAFRAASFKLRGHHQFLIYTSLAVFNLIMINVIVGILKSQGLNPLVGKVVAMCVIVVWNFLIFKRIIFKAAQED